MSTNAPAKVKEFDASSLEKIAYNSVKTIPTREPNDQYRLGYGVWSWLKEKKGTLDSAVRTSGARLLLPEAEAVSIIKKELHNAGL
jgi:hypothetical protein